MPFGTQRIAETVLSQLEKIKMRTILFCLLVLSLVSCQEKFSGTSEEEFKSSKLIVIKDLTTEEQKRLEKSLRVITLYAMAEKWNKPNNYTDKSINEITLDVVHNKTYSNVVKFAEDFLKKENDKKIIKIENEISEIELNRKKTDSIIKILEAFKATEININKGSWNEPTIYIKIVNKSDLTEITEYMFKLSITSISQNKVIDGVGSGGSYEEGRTKGEDDFFAYVSRSLSPIIEKSKRLENQLKNSKYPITNLKEYDLRVEVKPSKIVLKNGTRYSYPKKKLADYDTEIKILREQLKQLKSLNGRLDELVLQETTTENETAYNEEFLSLLKEIRETKNKPDERILKINKNLALTFPSKYEIKKEKSVGMYAFHVSDRLSFDNSDKNLIQYQIRDTTYIEYEDKYDKANGILNILKKENVSYDIKETINSLKTTNYYKLIDADNSGYIYFNNDSYHFIRYFKINGTHYLYSMSFNSLIECVQEFDRSNVLIK